MQRNYPKKRVLYTRVTNDLKRRLLSIKKTKKRAIYTQTT